MSDLPSLNALRAFDAVARLHSVTAAAAELSVTPSAISRQISNLEEEIGIPLMTRNGRGVRLTDDGMRLEGGLAGAFSQIAAAVDRLRRPASVQPLRIVVPPLLEVVWLNPRLRRFTAQYPGTDVIFAEREKEAEIWRRCDCAIAWGRFKDSATMVAQRVTRAEQVFPVCRPDVCGKAGLKGVTLLELETTAYAQVWPDWSAFETAVGLDLTDAVPGPRLTAGALVDAVRQGKGAMLSCTSLAQDDIAAGRLVRPVAETLPVEDAYWLLISGNGRHRQEVEDFRGWLLQESSASTVRGG